MAMVVISRLHFTKYLDKLKYNVMLTSLPRPADIGIDYRLGCFDLLILHNQYGLILGHIASVGDYFTLLKVPEEEREMITVEKLKEAISHLNKAELVLKYVVSDLPGVRVTKTLILPHISSELLQSSLCKCQHTKQVRCQRLRHFISFHFCLLQNDLCRPIVFFLFQYKWRLFTHFNLLSIAFFLFQYKCDCLHT